jgi:hypothetical protein
VSSQVAWRLAVARRAAAVSAEKPKVAIVAAVGSVGAGIADEWSDLEQDIYWHAPPTDDDRRRPIERLDGRNERFWDFSAHEEEWGEEYALGDLGVGISSFLVDSARRFIDLGALREPAPTGAQVDGRWLHRAGWRACARGRSRTGDGGGWGVRALMTRSAMRVAAGRSPLGTACA